MESIEFSLFLGGKLLPFSLFRKKLSQFTPTLPKWDTPPQFELKSCIQFERSEIDIFFSSQVDITPMC
ncbi:MAG: hypothetical protein C6I01_03905 [Epsilonproteobacteria bacterium]|nr:hypothetical protein [Campylobacterota bacterium]